MLRPLKKPRSKAFTTNMINNSKNSDVEKENHVDDEKRAFVKAACGIGASLVLLSLGSLEKFLRFFSKQDLTKEQQEQEGDETENVVVNFIKKSLRFPIDFLGAVGNKLIALPWWLLIPFLIFLSLYAGKVF